MAKIMTSSSRSRESLSLRLSKLKSYHSTEKYIWDIGCDHGILGLSFAGLQEVQEINLVDPSEPVIDKLKDKIKDSYITTRVLIHHLPGQKMEIKSKNNLIYIAGMGGEEIGEIISSLLPQLDSTSMFIISPHRKILELRSLLGELPVSLVKEEVLFEDNQHYQILALRPHSLSRPVSAYGEELWLGDTGRAYLKHQLNFFRLHRDEASQKYLEYLKTRK